MTPIQVLPLWAWSPVETSVACISFKFCIGIMHHACSGLVDFEFGGLEGGVGKHTVNMNHFFQHKVES